MVVTEIERGGDGIPSAPPEAVDAPASRSRSVRWSSASKYSSSLLSVEARRSADLLSIFSGDGGVFASSSNENFTGSSLIVWWSILFSGCSMNHNIITKFTLYLIKARYLRPPA